MKVRWIGEAIEDDYELRPAGVIREICKPVRSTLF